MKLKIVNDSNKFQVSTHAKEAIQEMTPFIPGIEIPENVKMAFSKYLDQEALVTHFKSSIQYLIDSKTPSEVISKAEDTANYILRAAHKSFYGNYNKFTYQERRTFLKIIDIYLVQSSTPIGIQSQTLPLQYMELGKDGAWRLKPGEMDIVITKEMLAPYNKDSAPNGFNVKTGIFDKSGRYEVSTAGDRGRQNTLYPWDGNNPMSFFQEAITAYSQNMNLAFMASRKDTSLQKSISEMKDLVSAYRKTIDDTFINRKGKKVTMTDSQLMTKLIDSGSTDAKAKFMEVSSKLKKMAGGEVRFNTELYQELFVRVAAKMGINVHTPKLEGENKTSIWMTSFIIFSEDYDMGNFFTSSHARVNYYCSKDVSDEGAQFLPDVSKGFAAVNEFIVREIEEKGSFVIPLSSTNDANIIRDIDGTDEYIALQETAVLTEDNIELVRRAAENGYTIIQDCVHGCMGPLMSKIFNKIGWGSVVRQLNTDYDPSQGGIGKDIVLDTKGKVLVDDKFQIKATLQTLKLDDEGVDASNSKVVKRMNYLYHLAAEKIGQFITNTDPDGDRSVNGEIVENTATKKAELDKYGIGSILLDVKRLFTFFSPNKMFLMTTAFYLDQLRESGKIKKGDTAVIIKTAQTSYAFNEFAAAYEKKHGIKVVCVEPTVGFKEIASAQRDIEAGIIINKQHDEVGEAREDVVITDALGHKHNLGQGNIVLVSGSEESGGQDLAPPTGIRSKLGRFALGNREKSAGTASLIVTIMGAKLFLEGKTILDYWKNLVDDYGLTFIQDDRHDEKLFDDGILDPTEFKKAKNEGNNRKELNSRFWWNLARNNTEGNLSLEQVKAILKESFKDSLTTEQLAKIDTLKEIKPLLTASKDPKDRAKDGVYLLFDDFYIAVRPSGTDPKIKGYYSGRFAPEEGLKIAKAMASFTPEEADWEKGSLNFFTLDPFN